MDWWILIPAYCFAIPRQVDLVTGQVSPLLKKKGSKKRATLYFSLVVKDPANGGNVRYVDMQADDADMCTFLSTRMTLLCIDMKNDEAWLDRHYDMSNPEACKKVGGKAAQ